MKLVFVVINILFMISCMEQPQTRDPLTNALEWEEYQVDFSENDYYLEADRNTAPTINANVISSIESGSQYEITILASDAEGSNLIFTVNNLPGWLSFDSSTMVLSGVPDEINVGFYQNISIGVSDGNSTTLLDPFSIVVTNTNDILALSGAPSVSVSENHYYQFAPYLKSNSGNPLVFSVANKPSWATFNPDSGVLSGTPNFFSSDTYSNILISVSDGENYAAISPFYINVLNQNRPPKIEGQNLSIFEDEKIDFVIAASDVDVDKFYWSLPNWPEHGELVFTNLDDNYVTYRPDPDFFGSDKFTVMITDSFGAVAQADFTVSVAPVNDIPIANVDNVYAARGVSQIIYVLHNDEGLGDGGLQNEMIDLQVTSLPTQGAITVNDNGSISYLANENATQLDDSFIYKITDTNNETSLASVNVRINALRTMNTNSDLIENTDADSTGANPGSIVNASPDPDVGVVTDSNTVVNPGSTTNSNPGSTVSMGVDCTVNCTQLINVSWLPSVSENVAGYYLYHGQVSRQYDNTIWVGQLTSFDHEIVSTGQAHYYSLKAVSFTGEFSEYSQELSLVF